MPKNKSNFSQNNQKQKRAITLYDIIIFLLVILIIWLLLHLFNNVATLVNNGPRANIDTLDICSSGVADDHYFYCKADKKVSLKAESITSQEIADHSVQLNDLAVEPCQDGQILVVANGQWVCADVPQSDSDSSNFVEVDPKVQTTIVNALPMWSGSALISTSLYYTQPGRLGINVANPSVALDVDGSSIISQDLTVEGEIYSITALHIQGLLYDKMESFGQSGFVLTSTEDGILWQNLSDVVDGAYWKTDGNSDTNPNDNYIGTADDADLSIRTNATERIRITAEGNIGINTANPQSNLDINGDIYLRAGLLDSNGFIGQNNYVLMSNGIGTLWTDIATITSDDQNLYWDLNTFTLSIEDGNTVDLSGLAPVWHQVPIGGYYTTDLVEPIDNNVQRIYMSHTGWGLTELQIRNDDNVNNYSGAVLSLKGSGPDYTNNMFFAKLGDNYYVPSWAGKGIVSSDQPLIIASVKSNDPEHPNNTPYIMFQTGGYYTAPVDRMILDSEGRLGIGDFSPDEKLTVAGNIHLTGDNPGIIHARQIDLEITTEPSRFEGGDILIHPGDFGGNSGIPKNVYMYAGRQFMGFSMHTGNVILLTDRDNNTIGHLLVGVNSDVTGLDTLSEFVLNNDPNYDHNMFLVRYDDFAENAPFLEFLRYRGDMSFRQDVYGGDVIGGLKAHAYAMNNFWNIGNILFDAVKIEKTGISGRIRFQVSNSDNNMLEAARIFDDGTVGIGSTDTRGQLSIRSRYNSSHVAVNILPYNKYAGRLAFTDAVDKEFVAVSAPEEIKDTYLLTLPQEQGNSLDVMYNDGNGHLYWSSVANLLALNLGDHAVAFANQNTVTGDPNNFYWDYNNNRLGINLAGNVPYSALHVRISGNTQYGILMEDSTGGRYPKFMVYQQNSNPLNAPRIQIDTGAIKGYYFSDERWSIGRDEFGSARAGLRLNHGSGIWADGYNLHLIARNFDAISINTLGSYYISTNDTFDVGIGTTSPGAKLQVGEFGDGTYALANEWQTFSDERLKENIEPIENALDKVLQLNGVLYNWKDGIDKSTQIGFIAQQVQNVLPQVVKQTTSGYLTLDYSRFTPLLTEAIKDQNKLVEDNISSLGDLTEVVNDLKKKISEITEKLDKLLGAITVSTDSISLNKRVEYTDKDMAGYITFKAGATSGRVNFKKSFKYAPIVNVSALENSANFYITDITNDGFTVKLDKVYNHDIKLSWIALAVKDPVNITFEVTPTITPEPVVTTTPTPTSTIVPTATPTPTPTPTVTPTLQVTPSLTPTPTPTVGTTFTPAPITPLVE